MFRVTGTVTYNDGRVVEYVAAQREVGAWERYAIRNALPIGNDAGAPRMLVTSVRYMAWAAVMRDEEHPESFEVWDATVLEVTAPQVEEDAVVNPTPGERSEGSSA